jgi:fructoselysine-6-P-deglycase FrlB-like protein
MSYRHGDLALISVKKLPKNLKETKTKVLMTGSGGNDHAITQGKVYLKNEGDFVFGYLVAKDTVLLHPEHGKGKGILKIAKIGDGIYELRKQNEDTNEGLKEVID